jgi:general secretion pathway protein L
MLIVHLLPEPTNLFDYVESLDGRHIAHSGQASAQDLCRFGSQVVAVVPWQVLAWHSINLPPGTGGRLNAVLNSLLEDSSLQDPSELHMVLGPNSANALRQGGTAMVVVCAKDWLRKALAPLTAAGLQVLRLVPEVCPSPVEDSAQLYWLDDGARVQALLCRHDSVWRLPQATNAWTAWEPVAHKTLWAEPSVAQATARLGDTPALLQTPPQRWLQACGNGWDMAQGEWAHHKGLKGWRWLLASAQALRFEPRWRGTRQGLALLVLVHLLGLNIWAWHAQAQVAQQRQQLQQLLTSTFPNVKVVVDAPVQMRREVQALQKNSAQASDTDLDVMLQTLSARWPSATPPTQLDYRGGTLRMAGLKPDALEVLSKAFANHNRYHFEVQGAQAVLQTKDTK